MYVRDRIATFGPYIPDLALDILQLESKDAISRVVEQPLVP